MFEPMGRDQSNLGVSIGDMPRASVKLHDPNVNKILLSPSHKSMHYFLFSSSDKSLYILILEIIFSLLR